MMKKKTIRNTVKKSRGKTKFPGGIHPVFGPVADPAPHFWTGPQIDPAPPLHSGGWRESLVNFVNREKLDANSALQLKALRIQRLHADIATFEQRVRILESEWAILAKRPAELQIDRSKFPGFPDPGDPAPEIRPIDFIRYVFDMRSSVLTRTIKFLKDSLAMIEGIR
jgi:hypothetical protein